MKEENNSIATLDLNEKTDKLATVVECPICRDKYLYAVPYAQVPCNKCGQTYKTDFKQDIYTKIARRLNQMLAWHNEVHLKASDAYERELINIADHFKRMNCWEISDITKTKEEFRYCLNCGICSNCFQCTVCDHIFVKDRKRRKQKCTSCNSNKFRRYNFVVEKNNKNWCCPNCKGKEIKMTRTTYKSQCHKCKSRNISEAKINNIFQVSIERKKAYRIENV